MARNIIKLELWFLIWTKLNNFLKARDKQARVIEMTIYPQQKLVAFEASFCQWVTFSKQHTVSWLGHVMAPMALIAIDVV